MFHNGRAKQTARKSTGGSVGTYSMAGQRREDNDEDLEDQDEDELDQEVLLAGLICALLMQHCTRYSAECLPCNHACTI